MKKLIALIFLSIFYSCGLDYEGGERIEFKGKILDENGNPLTNVYVKAVAEKDNWHDLDVISYDFTDANGNFSLHFPSPTNEDEMQLLVNYGDIDNHEITNLSRIKYYNIQDDNLTNFRLNFGGIELFDFDESTVILNIQFAGSDQYKLLGWNLSGKVVDNYINLSPLTNSEEVYFYSPNQVEIQPNQTIELTYYYQLYSGGGILQSAVPIEIQNQDLTYEITF